MGMLKLLTMGMDDIKKEINAIKVRLNNLEGKNTQTGTSNQTQLSDMNKEKTKSLLYKLPTKIKKSLLQSIKITTLLTIKETLDITKIISVQVFSIEQHMEQIIIINEEPDLVMSHFKMTHIFKVQDRLNALISTIIQIWTGIIEKVIKITKTS